MRLARLCALALVVLGSASTATAFPLDIASVRAPAVNCLFDTDCDIAVPDFNQPIPVSGASSPGVLQSRILPVGEAGTVGEGLYAYVYRVDLREVGAVTAPPCVRKLRLDFGPIEPLDYDGDGDPDDVYVVTRGAVGSVAPSSAEQSGRFVTFTFDPGVCPGTRPGAGESSFFVGLASKRPSRTVPATVTLDVTGDVTVQVKAPEAASPRPSGSVGCQVGPSHLVVPIDPSTPACRCLQDDVLRLDTHCGFVLPGLVGFWTLPRWVPPGDPFPVDWFVLATSREGVAARVEVLPPKGFSSIGGKEAGPRQQAQAGLATARAWLVAAGKPGAYTGRLRITLPSSAASKAGASFEISFPIDVTQAP